MQPVYFAPASAPARKPQVSAIATDEPVSILAIVNTATTAKNAIHKSGAPGGGHLPEHNRRQQKCQRHKPRDPPRYPFARETSAGSGRQHAAQEEQRQSQPFTSERQAGKDQRVALPREKALRQREIRVKAVS